MRKHPAHNREDETIARLLPPDAPKFYVDVGANDPFRNSNSHPFYEIGWRGIDIEPLPGHARELREAHPENQVFECCVGREAGNIVLYMVDQLSTTKLEILVRQRHIIGPDVPVSIQVPTRTLDSIFAECGVQEIGFLSLDVEGSEADALAGLNLLRYRPLVLCVEATLPSSSVPSHEDWEPGVIYHGYRFVEFDGCNRFYVRYA